jgi:hypothetical protein
VIKGIVEELLADVLAKGILVWSDFRPRWGGKFVMKVIRR